jgi:hypothetical protein
MEKDKIIAHDHINFPVTLEKGFIRVSADSRTPFDTQVLYVYVPRQFRVPATVLSDRAILEKEDLLTMIPFSLSKADPEVFYDQLALHQQFLENHKNIQIHNVPTNHYAHSKEQINGTEQSLCELLQSNTKILRIYQFDEEAKLNISVRDSDYFSLTKWIDLCLEQFVEYHPKRVYGSPIVRFTTEVGSTSSDAKSKFSSKFIIIIIIKSSLRCLFVLVRCVSHS